MAEAKLHEDKERAALALADEQYQKDKACLAEARQKRKIASIQKVVDTQQTNGQVSLANHDQMQQILQQLNINRQNHFSFLPPKEDASEDMLVDLTGFRQVTGKKKSPKKTQPKTIVDSPRSPRTPHHHAISQLWPSEIHSMRRSSKPPSSTSKAF